MLLSLDAEKSALGPEWARKFNVRGFPTSILLNPDGTEIDRVSGYAPMPRFLEVFQGYARGEGTLDALQEELAASPDDLELSFHVVNKLEARGADGWQELARDILRRDPGNESGFASSADALLVQAAYRADSDPAHLEGLCERWPGSEESLNAHNRLVTVYRRAENPEKAREHLKAIYAGFGDNAQALNSFAWICGEMDWNLKEALRAAHEAVRLVPGDANVLDTLAELQWKNGQKEKALATIGQALELDPANDYLKEQQKKFRE